MYCTTLCFAIRTMLNCTSESWRCCAALQEASGGAMLQFWTVPCNIRLHKQFNAACNTLGASQSAQRDLHDLLDHALLRKIVQYSAIYSIVQSVTAMGNIRPCPGRCSPVVFPLAGFPSKQRANPSPRAMSQPIIPSRSSQPSQVNQPSPDQPAQPA